MVGVAGDESMIGLLREGEREREMVSGAPLLKAGLLL